MATAKREGRSFGMTARVRWAVAAVAAVALTVVYIALREPGDRIFDLPADLMTSVQNGVVYSVQTDPVAGATLLYGRPVGAWAARVVDREPFVPTQLHLQRGALCLLDQWHHVPGGRLMSLGLGRRPGPRNLGSFAPRPTGGHTAEAGARRTPSALPRGTEADTFVVVPLEPRSASSETPHARTELHPGAAGSPALDAAYAAGSIFWWQASRGSKMYNCYAGDRLWTELPPNDTVWTCR